MQCARCRRYRDRSETFFVFPGWKTEWQKGKFWFCHNCLDELLGWWLDLTLTMCSPDPSKQPKGKRL